MLVTGISVAKAEAIRLASIVSGVIDAAGNLKLVNGAGAETNAGQVVVPLASWPIGSIYIGATPTSPTTLFGGTWSRFGAGRVLVSQNSADVEFDTAEEVGGSKTHTLTPAQMPNHAHAITNSATGAAAIVGNDSTVVPLGSGGTAGIFAVTQPAGTALAASAGGGAPHPILPPYIVVYMWRRTA